MFDLRAGAGFQCLLKCDMQKELSRQAAWEGSCDSGEGSHDSGEVGGVFIHSGKSLTAQSDRPDVTHHSTVETGTALMGVFYLPLHSADPLSVRLVLYRAA